MADYEEIGERWIRQAVHDLEIAEKNLPFGGFDSAAFYSHQSVEKLLKGIISLSGRPIPRTHDLERLCDLLSCPDEVISDLIDLMGDYQTSRYPDISEIIPCEYYTEEIATDRVRISQKIFQHNIQGKCQMSDPVLDTFRREIVPKIMELFHPETVIIFGSRISGNAHEDSDLDIILVSEQFEHVPQHQRLPLVRKSIRTPFSLDYLCYTPDEFERMKTRSSVLASTLSGPHLAI